MESYEEGLGVEFAGMGWDGTGLLGVETVLEGKSDDEETSILARKKCFFWLTIKIGWPEGEPKIWEEMQNFLFLYLVIKRVQTFERKSNLSSAKLITMSSSRRIFENKNFLSRVSWLESNSSVDVRPSSKDPTRKWTNRQQLKVPDLVVMPRDWQILARAPFLMLRPQG